MNAPRIKIGEYAPRADSVAERAMIYLQHNGPTSNSELADAIDSDSGVMSASLSTAVRFGAVVKTQTPEGPRWSLGDGVPPSDEAPAPSEISTPSAAATAGSEAAQAPQLHGEGAATPNDGRPAGSFLPAAVIASVQRRHGTAANPPASAPAQAALPPVTAPATSAPPPAAVATPAAPTNPMGHSNSEPIGDAPTPMATSVDLLITLSIRCTPHQAERISQFVRSMTEVRSQT